MLVVRERDQGRESSISSPTYKSGEDYYSADLWSQEEARPSERDIVSLEAPIGGEQSPTVI